MVVMSFALLTGCGSDPVYDDLENFLNVEMVEINADYEKITAEVGTWETLEDDTARIITTSRFVIVQCCYQVQQRALKWNGTQVQDVSI